MNRYRSATKAGRAAEPMLMKSVGWVVAQDAERIVLAAHRTDDSASMGGELCIPRATVRKVRRLKL